jgi:hypothetical protein
MQTEDASDELSMPDGDDGRRRLRKRRRKTRCALAAPAEDQIQANRRNVTVKRVASRHNSSSHGIIRRRMNFWNCNRAITVLAVNVDAAFLRESRM